MQGKLRFRSIWLGLPGVCGPELRRYVNPQVHNGVAVRYLAERFSRRAAGLLLVSGDDRASRVRRGDVTDFRPLRHTARASATPTCLKQPRTSVQGSIPSSRVCL